MARVRAVEGGGPLIAPTVGQEGLGVHRQLGARAECGRPADMVDHIVAPKGDMILFRDKSNWQPYNGLCNRRKNIKSEGGFNKRYSAITKGRV